MEITCNQTGYKAIVNFKPYSWSNKELHKLDGYIYDNKYIGIKSTNFINIFIIFHISIEKLN